MTASRRKVTLDDIAGYPEEKDEIRKLINLLRNYDKYSKMGIYVPRGLILQGPPGCGKTLIARAVANECGVTFVNFKCSSASSNVLGDLKKAFAKAEKKCPSILYIDEINQVVSGDRFVSDTSRATLQFLLTKLDGTGTKGSVMVIASTNVYNDLPEPLVRNGRMDKKLLIGYPDLESRKAIFDHYAQGHSMFDSVNSKELAMKLKGMSGADIKTLVNNAMIEYVDEKDSLCVDDFKKLIDSMHFETIGKKWRNRFVASKVMAHEMGHALVGLDADGNPGSITVERYGSTSGFTDYTADPFNDYDDDVDSNSEEQDDIFDRRTLLAEIRKALGGMAGEKVYLGTFDTGVGSDLQAAHELFMYGLQSGLFGLPQIPFFLRDDSESDKKRTKRLQGRIFKEQFRKACSCIRKNRALGMYLIEKALESGDSLTERQMADGIANFKVLPRSQKAKFGRKKLKKDSDKSEREV